MKKILLLIGFNLSLVFALHAARPIEGTITNINGRVVKATFLIPFGFLSSKPSFQKLQEGIRYLDGKKKVTLRPDDVKEISFTYNGIKVRMISVYDNLQLSSSWTSQRNKFLKLEVDGIVRLYDYYATSYSPGTYSSGSGMMTGGGSYVYERFVLQRNDGELMRPRGLRFKKDMAEFFADCPELIEKIEAGLFRKSDLEVIVREYNSKCN